MKKVLILIITLSFLGKMWAQDEPKYIQKKILVADSLAWEIVIAKEQAALDRKIDSLKTPYNELSKKCMDLNEMNIFYGNEYEDIKTEWQKEVARELLKNNEREILHKTGQKGTLKSIAKDIEKGKLPKSMLRLMDDYRKDLKRQLDDVQSRLKYIERRRALDGYELIANPPQKEAYISVLNPRHRENIPLDSENLDKLDKELQTKGWEWLNKSTELKEVTVKYPVQATYRMSPSHPEYQIANFKVFKDYKLVRIHTLLRYDFWMSDYNFINEIKKLVYKTDFLNNKYDIHKENENVKEALLYYFGDEKTVKKIQETQAKAMKYAIQKSLQAQNVRNRRQAEAMRMEGGFAMLVGMTAGDSPIADNFIKQLMQDHEKDFYHVYKVQRLDDTSFKIVFLDNTGKSTYTAKVTFSSQESTPTSKTSLFAVTGKVELLNEPPFSIDLSSEKMKTK